ncbi:MAG TPA: hypothetical protein PKO06_10865 [Candidatus Ozemobacteraceae bacterium]|mgnify:CR=1 FL=1|nr:hypothetical protein [Candidatus Ozemobacteraceae bacterium]
MSSGSGEQELIAQLQSDKRSVRVAAIVQLAKVSRDRQVLLKLRDLAQSGDREVSFFAAQAVARIQSRLGEQSADQASGAGLTREKLIKPLKDEIAPLLALIRQNPAVIAEELRLAVADFLSRYGEAADGQIVKTWLESCQDNLGLYYIDALESLNPSLLEPLLPALLASALPLVRSRAIVALQKIDPEEALAHLQELLASRQPEQRLAGFRNAFFFPFEQIREVVLAILPEETDREVLQAASILIASNPEPETALRLLDMIDTVGKEQGKRLTEIFHELCGALKVSGLVAPELATPEKFLERWKKERLQKFLRDLEVQLPVATPARREAIESWLKKNLSHPAVRDFIRRLAQNQATEDLARKLLPAGALQGGAPASGSSSAEASAIPPTARQAPRQPLTDAEKISRLAALEEPVAVDVLAWVRAEAGQGAPAVRAEALLALSRLSPKPEDAALGEAGIINADSQVVSASVKLLETIDPARLVPFLSIIWSSEDPRVRVRGLKVALQHDQKTAVEEFRRMVRSADPAQRAEAVAGVFHFPFALVESILLDALRHETHGAIARQILVVLLMNPKRQMLTALDAMQGKVAGSVAILIAQARIDLYDLLLKLQLIAPEGTTAETEKETPATSAKPYAVSRVREEIRKREAAAWRSPALPDADKARGAGGGWNTTALVAVAIVLLAILPLLFLRRPPPPPRFDPQADDQRFSTDSSRKIPLEFRMNRLCRLRGTVTTRHPDGSIYVETESGRLRVFLQRQASAPAQIASGPVEVEVIPYRKSKYGEIWAEGHALRQ